MKIIQAYCGRLTQQLPPVKPLPKENSLLGSTPAAQLKQANVQHCEVPLQHLQQLPFQVEQPLADPKQAVKECVITQAWLIFAVAQWILPPVFGFLAVVSAFLALMPEIGLSWVLILL